MPYTEAQAILDEDYPDGWRYYWKSVNVTGLGDEMVDRLVERIAVTPSPHSTIDVWYQGGAMAAVGERDTAFANRAAALPARNRGQLGGRGGFRRERRLGARDGR